MARKLSVNEARNLSQQMDAFAKKIDVEKAAKKFSIGGSFDVGLVRGFIGFYLIINNTRFNVGIDYRPRGEGGVE